MWVPHTGLSWGHRRENPVNAGVREEEKGNLLPLPVSSAGPPGTSETPLPKVSGPGPAAAPSTSPGPPAASLPPPLHGRRIVELLGAAATAEAGGTSRAGKNTSACPGLAAQSVWTRSGLGPRAWGASSQASLNSLQR